MAGFLVAGLFEHNFGDAEVVMLVYALMAQPWVVARELAAPSPTGRDPAPTPDSQSPLASDRPDGGEGPRARRLLDGVERLRGPAQGTRAARAPTTSGAGARRATVRRVAGSASSTPSAIRSQLRRGVDFR